MIILVDFIIVNLGVVHQGHWMELMLRVCPSLMVHQADVPIFGHMLLASKSLPHMIVTVPVLRTLVQVLLLSLAKTITVKVLQSIALHHDISGIQAIPCGTMKVALKEAIAVIPHELLGL
jgi:hypothetical protein